MATETDAARIERLTEYLTRDRGSVPCSRYGRDSDDCAPWAIAALFVYEACNGPADVDDYEAADGYMSLVVNDHEDIAYLVREYGYELPAALQWLRDEDGAREGGEDDD